VTWRAAAVLAGVLFSTCASSEDSFRQGQPVNLQTGSAYVFVRISGKICNFLTCVKVVPYFIRTLSSEELNQASVLAEQDPDHWKDRVEPNVVRPSVNQPYADEGEYQVYLMSLRPGTYVFGGVWGGLMGTTLSMGSVKFDARPDVITDLGTVITAPDDQPTTIPELKDSVTGKGIGDVVVPYAAAIKPPSTGDAPQDLKLLPFTAADYSAVQPFPNYLGASLMRLAPMPGVLGYDKDGQVLDLKSVHTR